LPASSQRIFEASNVEGALGSGMAARAFSSAEARERREFLAAAFADRVRELALEVAEVQEGRGGSHLLAHEEHRHRGREKQRGGGKPEPLGRCERDQALAERAVADLVMVLQEGDEGRGRQVRRRLPANLPAAVRARIALVGEALGEAAREHPRGALRVVGVVAVALAGDEHVRRVVPVVVPLRGRVRGAGAIEEMRRVAVVLEHEVDVAVVARARGDGARDLGHDVRRGIVGDGVDRIHAQPVEVELLDPVERVVDEEGAHVLRALAVEVDRRTPRGLVRGVEELGRIEREVVALGPEVVVDHVEQHHQAALVRRHHEALEIVGRP
jgi:hypothetical protein